MTSLTRQDGVLGGAVSSMEVDEISRSILDSGPFQNVR